MDQLYEIRRMVTDQGQGHKKIEARVSEPRYVEI